MTEDRGPSWWDVAQAHDWICGRFNVTVELLLVPNVRRDRGAPEYGWVAVARVVGRGQRQELGPAAQHRYGKGGSWRTAPSALLQCLADVQTALEARESATRAKHAI